MTAEELAEVARDVLGDDRVHVRPDLADALDTALALAEVAAGGDDVTSGVVVTGSVYLVAEARTLLGAPAPDSLALDTTSRGVSAVAEDTGAPGARGRRDHRRPRRRRSCGSCPPTPGPEPGRTPDRFDPSDPWDAPEDSALLDDPTAAGEEQDDLWDDDGQGGGRA